MAGPWLAGKSVYGGEKENLCSSLLYDYTRYPAISHGVSDADGCFALRKRTMSIDHLRAW